MNTKQLQVALAQNRLALSTLYEYKASLKESKKKYDKMGYTPGEYDCHNRLKKITKDIAKLVDLQKALKQEVKDVTLMARVARHLSTPEMQETLRQKGETEAAVENLFKSN